MGISHDVVRNEVAARRWQRLGHQTIVPHLGAIDVAARRWSAIWEVGAGIASLDGVTALQHAGLKGYADDDIHVSVVHTCAIRRVAGVRLHKVIRRLEDEVLAAGMPRTVPAVAALRGATWARSDRQAALILVMTVQQGLATPQQLHDWFQRVRGRSRRAFIRRTILDLFDGVRAIGELDFAHLCRRRGLPEPSRQVLRQGPRGRIYLDVRWDCCGLVVEIDGAQHRQGLAVTADNLRQNAVVLTGDRVLRIDLVGLRLHPAEFLAQVAAAHRCGRAAISGSR